MNTIDKLISEIQKLGYEINIKYYEDERNEHSSRFWKISDYNDRLENSPFFFNQENDFIHFTSLENLYSILNTKHFRLYNLVHMDDKFELDYAKKELSLHDSFEEEKERFYCLSMCSSQDVINSEEREHLLWKLHGRNGYGVMLRISFQNDIHRWYNYHITKMYYSADGEIFRPIKELNLQTKNDFFDSKLACFIKLPIYRFESEIRLIFDNRYPWKDQNEFPIYHYEKAYLDELSKNENVSYVQLPILNYDTNDGNFVAHAPVKQLFEIPKIHVTEIILGYRYSKKEKENIRRKFDYQKIDIKISQTDLKKYF